MSERYRLSVTIGGLFLRESSSVAACYFVERGWKKARVQVRRENLLKLPTAASATRISEEMTVRVELLDDTVREALLDHGLAEAD
ncbi:MAG: BrxA family protein [Acidovorax sp.]